MHIRYPRAAVDVDDTAIGNPSRPAGASSGVVAQHIQARPQRPLWASKAMSVPAGRLIGVRQRGDLVEVGLVRPGADTIRWVAVAEVLTEREARRWLGSAKFAP